MKHNVLLAGRSKDNLHSLEAAMRGEAGLNVSLRLIENGHSDPLYGLGVLPDVLVFDLGAAWEEELKAFGQNHVTARPSLIAVGPAGDPQMMRMAMQAGARDFFTRPVPAPELLAAVKKIALEGSARSRQKEGSLTAVINAKGGSGGSFLACNLAHIMTAHIGLRVLLLDLDVQFGTLALYLDLNPGTGLVDALNAADQLDGLALEGHAVRHASGLRLLASRSNEVASPWQIPQGRINKAISVAKKTFDCVVVDVPRQIDPLTSAVLEQANHILIVMQQSLSGLREAAWLARIIKRDLAVPGDHIHIVVNRHQENAEVGTADIAEAFKEQQVFVVPNDFKRVVQTLNNGVPIFEFDPKLPISRSIQDMAIKLSGREPAKRPHFLRQIISQLRAR